MQSFAFLRGDLSGQEQDTGGKCCDLEKHKGTDPCVLSTFFAV